MDAAASTSGAPAGDADALTERLFAAMLDAGGASAPSAAAHSRALALLDATFPELRLHFAGAVTASPAAEAAGGAAQAEYLRTTGALLALAASLAGARADRQQQALDLLTAGERGPMSLTSPASRGVSLGHNAPGFAAFAAALARALPTPDARWAHFVLVALHDVGKSDTFRAAVNATLPPEERSDDHDAALARALASPPLRAALLPSAAALPPQRLAALAAAAAAGFHLPQALQGEAPPEMLARLRAAARSPALRGDAGAAELNAYLFHTVFDIAGAGCTAASALPLALEPVFVTMVSAKDALLAALAASTDAAAPDADADLYFRFLHIRFQAAYPQFAATLAAAAADAAWRAGEGLALLRALALTRNTHAAPEVVHAALRDPAAAPLREHLCGAASPPALLLYYAPDLLRMGLGRDLAAGDAAGTAAALRALARLFDMAHAAAADHGQPAYTLNCAPAVAAIRAAGAAWGGGAALLALLDGASIAPGASRAEGTLQLASAQ